MSFEKSRSRPRPSTIESEEERAWVTFYRRVGRDPAIATEVMAQFESDPDMKSTHLALYLCCKESLRRHKAWQARNKRIGQFVRWLCLSLFVQPWRSLQEGLRHGSELAVECLPEVTKEPAVAPVSRLSRDAGFATARTRLDQQAANPPSISTEAQASTSAKVPRAAA